MSLPEPLKSIKSIQPIAHWEVIEQGLSHKCYKVISNGKSYFVKLFQNVHLDKDGALQQIISNYVLAADNKLSPSIIEFDLIRRFIVTEFVIGNSLTHNLYKDSDKQRILAMCLRRCHQLKPVNLANNLPINIQQIILNCAKYAQLTGCQLNHLRHYCQPYIQQITQPKNNLTFVHGDLNYGNIIVNNNDIKVVDWDCATLAEAEFDIAMALSINCINTSDLSLFMTYYLENDSNTIKIKQEKVTCYLVLCNIINALWYLGYSKTHCVRFSDNVQNHFVFPLQQIINSEQ